MKLSADFRFKYRSGGWFSSRETGFITVEGEEQPRKGETTPALQIHRHASFVTNVMERGGSRCLWVVDCPSDSAGKVLREKFIEHRMISCSLAGYFEPERATIASYWKIFAEHWDREPWNMEQPWALAGISAELPDPPPAKSFLMSSTWSLEHLLKNHDKIDSIFVQMGWFSFFSLRESKYSKEFIFEEFPDL